jgi:hypothetical protein
MPIELALDLVFRLSAGLQKRQLAPAPFELRALIALANRSSLR